MASQADFLKARAKKNLAQAVETMRRACDEAERSIDSDSSIEVATQRVLHSLSWGFANASSSIESAMAAASDLHEVDILELQR